MAWFPLGDTNWISWKPGVLEAPEGPRSWVGATRVNSTLGRAQAGFSPNEFHRNHFFGRAQLGKIWGPQNAPKWGGKICWRAMVYRHNWALCVDYTGDSPNPRPERAPPGGLPRGPPEDLWVPGPKGWQAFTGESCRGRGPIGARFLAPGGPFWRAALGVSRRQHQDFSLWAPWAFLPRGTPGSWRPQGSLLIPRGGPFFCGAANLGGIYLGPAGFFGAPREYTGAFNPRVWAKSIFPPWGILTARENRTHERLPQREHASRGFNRALEKDPRGPHSKALRYHTGAPGIQHRVGRIFSPL